MSACFSRGVDASEEVGVAGGVEAEEDGEEEDNGEEESEESAMVRAGRRREGQGGVKGEKEEEVRRRSPCEATAGQEREAVKGLPSLAFPLSFLLSIAKKIKS